MKKRLAKIKKDLRFKKRKLLDVQLGRPALRTKVKHKKEPKYFSMEKRIFRKTTENSIIKMNTQLKKPDKINVFEKFSNKRHNTYSAEQPVHSGVTRRTRRMLSFYKQRRYKSRRFINTFFRYARWRTRNFDHLLKNMIVTKRYLAYCSGRMRKRQFKAFLKKVNGQINRTTNARMHYVLSFNGLLTNALYQIRFCHPVLFKFMGLLICNGYILVNERTARYRNAYVQPGDKLEVAHEFWSKLTRPNLPHFFFRIGKYKRVKRRFRANRLKYRALLKQSKRYYRFFYRKRRRYARRSFKRITKQVRWKLGHLVKNPKRRHLHLNFKGNRETDIFSRCEFPDFFDPLYKRKLRKKRRRVDKYKKTVYRNLRRIFMVWYKLKLYYLLKYCSYIIFRKRIKRLQLRKFVNILLRRHFKAFRFLAFRVARRIIRRCYSDAQHYFGRFRSLRWRYYAAHWEICFFARTAYYLTPTYLYNVKDKRFKQSFLWRTLKAYSYFPY